MRFVHFVAMLASPLSVTYELHAVYAFCVAQGVDWNNLNFFSCLKMSSPICLECPSLFRRSVCRSSYLGVFRGSRIIVRCHRASGRTNRWVSWFTAAHRRSHRRCVKQPWIRRGFDSERVRYVNSHQARAKAASLQKNINVFAPYYSHSKSRFHFKTPFQIEMAFFPRLFSLSVNAVLWSVHT